MLGADHRGQRLNTLYRENIVEAEILDALDPLLADYAGNRAQDEGFGDFLVRRAILAPPDSRGRAGLPIEVHACPPRPTRSPPPTPPGPRPPPTPGWPGQAAEAASPRR